MAARWWWWWSGCDEDLSGGHRGSDYDDYDGKEHNWDGDIAHDDDYNDNNDYGKRDNDDRDSFEQG